MNTVNRRQWLASLAVASVVPGVRAGLAQQTNAQGKQTPPKLPLEDYVPKSMLHVPETKLSRSRFPVIDFHTHLSRTPRGGDKPQFNATREQVLAVMDRRNVRAMVNLTGGYGPVLDENIRYWQKPSPDRFVVFTERGLVNSLNRTTRSFRLTRSRG